MVLIKHLYKILITVIGRLNKNMLIDSGTNLYGF